MVTQRCERHLVTGYLSSGAFCLLIGTHENQSPPRLDHFVLRQRRTVCS